MHEALILHEGAADDKAILDTLYKLVHSYKGMKKEKDMKVYVGAALLLAKKMQPKNLNNLDKMIKQLEIYAEEVGLKK